VHLLCLHQVVEGAQVGPSNYTFRSNPDVVRGRDIPAGLAAVLAGHIHRAQALTHDSTADPLRRRCFYPGSVERTAYAERDEVKGYMLVAVESETRAEARFVPLPARPMHLLTLTPSSAEAPALEAQVRERLAALPEDAVVRVELHGALAEAACAQLSAVRLRALAPKSMNVELGLPRAAAAPVQKAPAHARTRRRKGGGPDWDEQKRGVQPALTLCRGAGIVLHCAQHRTRKEEMHEAQVDVDRMGARRGSVGGQPGAGAGPPAPGALLGADSLALRWRVGQHRSGRRAGICPPYVGRRAVLYCRSDRQASGHAPERWRAGDRPGRRHAGASYYLVHPVPGKPSPDWTAFGRVVFDDGTQALLRSTPEAIDRLALAGASIAGLTLTPKPLRPASADGGIPTAVDWDPLVQAMIDEVQTAKVSDYDRKLAGELPVWVDNGWYTITSRYTYSGTPIQKPRVG